MKLFSEVGEYRMYGVDLSLNNTPLLCTQLFCMLDETVFSILQPFVDGLKLAAEQEDLGVIQAEPCSSADDRIWERCKPAQQGDEFAPFRC